jgi:hypothetical protein
MQPRLAQDRQGTVHLVYLTGDPARSDVWYTTLNPDEKRFSIPLRVNSIPGSAVAMGTVRGAELALRKDGEVLVAWVGSQKVARRQKFPLCYSRFPPNGSIFEKQKSMAFGLDAGATVSADAEGRAYLAWTGPGKKEGEAFRRVWLRKSDDGGKSFGKPAAVSDEPRGACGCCGIAMAAVQRQIAILYRSAAKGTDRGMHLITAYDDGTGLHDQELDKWRLDACPLSTSHFFQSMEDQGLLGTWENQGKIYFSWVGGEEFIPTEPLLVSKGPDDKHPASVQSKESIFFAWAEGTGWGRGGKVGWQLLGKGFKPISNGEFKDLPVWSFPAAFADSKGNFTVVY